MVFFGKKHPQFNTVLPDVAECFSPPHLLNMLDPYRSSLKYNSTPWLCLGSKKKILPCTPFDQLILADRRTGKGLSLLG
jgi:hypothetical protein